MTLKLFKIISLPFYLIFEFLYGLIFQITPVGEGVFAVEKRMCKYRGQAQKFPDQTEIKCGDAFTVLHLKKDKLNELFSRGFVPEEKIREMVEFSLDELAQFSINTRGYGSVAFGGETSIYFPKARDFGFIMAPIGNKFSNFLASLQFLYLRKSCRKFPKRKLYLYLISTKTLEEKFGPKENYPASRL